jgi:hypothetical protein
MVRSLERGRAHPHLLGRSVKARHGPKRLKVKDPFYFNGRTKGQVRGKALVRMGRRGEQ